MGEMAGIYCRISRDSEGEELGVERQKALCVDLADRLGLTVADCFIDNDRGASDLTRASKTRPRYDDLLEAVRTGAITTIIAYSNSRLTRRMSELETLAKTVIDAEAKIRTVVSGDLDLSTADGLTMARVLASIDAGEALRISERSKAAFRHKARQGEPRITSHRPFGWLADGKTLDPIEADLIRQGVSDLASGMPLNHIRKRWEESGVKTPAGGSRWHWSNTLSVLTSYRTIGVATYKGKPQRDKAGEYIRGNWTPITTDEDREAALLQVRARKVLRKRSGRYLLSGLLRCGECGASMWGSMASGKGRSDGYLCSGGSGHVAISAERLENLVMWEVYERLLNRALYGEAAGLPGEEGDRARLAKRAEAEAEAAAAAEEQAWAGEERLAEASAAISALMKSFTSGRLDWETVEPEVIQLEAEVRELKDDRERHEALQAVPRRTPLLQVENTQDWFLELDSKSWEEKQSLIRQETQAIVVAKGIRGVASRTEEAFRARVHIAWRDLA